MKKIPYTTDQNNPTVKAYKEAVKHGEETMDLRKEISEILIKWGCPTRQVMISELIELYERR